jgi:hypothetical protein
VGEVVIMAVGYNDQVYDWEVVDMAWHGGVAFWSHEGEGAAAILEYGVEEDSETAGKLNIVTRMP